MYMLLAHSFALNILTEKTLKASAIYLQSTESKHKDIQDNFCSHNLRTFGKILCFSSGIREKNVFI